ncbi:MAG: hypothetical protein V1820_00460 [archaeon]
MPKKPADEMRSLGLKVCGDCSSWKSFTCESPKLKVRFPAAASDPACQEFVPKRK